MYLKDKDHVSRHVPYTRLHKDENDNPTGILPQAFELRVAKNETALSVNWLEYFGGDHQSNIAATITNFRKHRKELGHKVGANSAFGIGNVGVLEETCSFCAFPNVRVVHKEKKEHLNNKSHARIIRLPINDKDLMGLLASEVFTELILNASIPE